MYPCFQHESDRNFSNTHSFRNEEPKVPKNKTKNNNKSSLRGMPYASIQYPTQPASPKVQSMPSSYSHKLMPKRGIKKGDNQRINTSSLKKGICYRDRGKVLNGR